MKFTHLIVALLPLASQGVQITTFDDRSFMEEGLVMEFFGARDEGSHWQYATEWGLVTEGSTMRGRVSADGYLTTARWDWHGPELQGVFSFNNETGEVLEDSVMQYLFPGEPGEAFAHETVFWYDLVTGDTVLKWREGRAAEVMASGAAAIPDGGWAFGMLALGLGVIGRWRK